MVEKAAERWPELAIEPGLALPTEVQAAPRAFVAAVLAAVFDCEGRSLALSVLLCGDREIARIHGAHMNDFDATDVISFSLRTADAPGSDSCTDLDHAGFADGELIVSAEFAKKSAERCKNSWQAELALYLVHGCLHLLGYDDRDEASLRRMKRAERRVLDVLDLPIGTRFD